MTPPSSSLRARTLAKHWENRVRFNLSESGSTRFHPGAAGLAGAPLPARGATRLPPSQRRPAGERIAPLPGVSPTRCSSPPQCGSKLVTCWRLIEPGDKSRDAANYSSLGPRPETSRPSPPFQLHEKGGLGALRQEIRSAIAPGRSRRWSRIPITRRPHPLRCVAQGDLDRCAEVGAGSSRRGIPGRRAGGGGSGGRRRRSGPTTKSSW